MIKLIENARSPYVILSGTNPCERFAAQELQAFLKQSTGCSLEIIETPNGTPYLSIGNTLSLQEENIEIEWSKSRKDSFFCRQIGVNFYLCGRRSRGTLYAVYDFLEKWVGVRFLASNETFVPKRKEVYISNADCIEEPAFDIRSFFTVQMEKDSLYTARLRQVALYGEEKAEYGYGLQADGFLEPHNIFCDLDIPRLREEHPEYIWKCPLESGFGEDLCYSQGITEQGEIETGGLADLVANSLLKRIEKNPQKTWFSLCQNDVPQGCTCAKCQKNLQRYGNHSAILLRFINAVARKVENWRKHNAPEREIRIVTFAYAYTLQAPKETTVKPEKNVWIWFASADQNMLYTCDDPNNEEFQTILAGWQKITDRFCYWDYRINFAEYLLYYPGLRHFAQDFAFLEKLGVDYLFCEAASGDLKDCPVWLNEIKGYVASKLMWNTKADAKQLTKEFCTLYYGRFAESVLKVIDLFEDNYERLKREVPTARIYLLLGYRTCESDYYPLSMLLESIDILKAAIEQCKDEKLYKRLLNVLCTPERMLLRNYSDYFATDHEGKEKLYREFLEHCKALGFENLGGWDFTVDNLIKYPDYNWWKMHGVAY